MISYIHGMESSGKQGMKQFSRVAIACYKAIAIVFMGGDVVVTALRRDRLPNINLHTTWWEDLENGYDINGHKLREDALPEHAPPPRAAHLRPTNVYELERIRAERFAGATGQKTKNNNHSSTGKK